MKKRVGRRRLGRGGSAILQRKPWRWARTVYHSASEFVVPRLVTSQSFLPATPNFYPPRRRRQFSCKRSETQDARKIFSPLFFFFFFTCCPLSRVIHLSLQLLQRLFVLPFHGAFGTTVPSAFLKFLRWRGRNRVEPSSRRPRRFRLRAIFLR